MESVGATFTTSQWHKGSPRGSSRSKTCVALNPPESRAQATDPTFRRSTAIPFWVGPDRCPDCWLACVTCAWSSVDNHPWPVFWPKKVGLRAAAGWSRPWIETVWCDPSGVWVLAARCVPRGSVLHYRRSLLFRGRLTIVLRAARCFVSRTGMRERRERIVAARHVLYRHVERGTRRSTRR
jgi:hypothetical protein